MDSHTIIFVVYMALGYWACGETIFANKIRIGTMSDLFLTRVILGVILGWALVPIAIIKMILHR